MTKRVSHYRVFLNKPSEFLRERYCSNVASKELIEEYPHMGFPYLDCGSLDMKSSDMYLTFVTVRDGIHMSIPHRLVEFIEHVYEDAIE
jgi:hypothetical protein